MLSFLLYPNSWSGHPCKLDLDINKSEIKELNSQFMNRVFILGQQDLHSTLTLLHHFSIFKKQISQFFDLLAASVARSSL